MSVQVINVLPIHSELSEAISFENLKILTLNKKTKSVIKKFYSFLINFLKDRKKEQDLFVGEKFLINEHVLKDFCIENNEFESANKLILSCECKITCLN